MGTPGLARAQLLLAAVLFSTGGAVVKATTLDGWQVAGFRSGIAGLAVFLLLPAARRRPTVRIGLVACAYAATLILYVTANKLTTAANTIFLQSTAPLYLIALGPLLLGEAVRRRDVAFLVSLAGGLALFFVGVESRFETAPRPLEGNLLAAASGLTWALTILGLRWIGRAEPAGTSSPAVAVVVGNAIAFLFCAPFAFPVVTSTTVDWALLGYLGVFQVGVAYIFVTRAVRQVPALEAALLLLVEPVLNPIWAWALHGEVPGPFALAGCGIILASVLVKTLVDTRTAPPVAGAHGGQVGSAAIPGRTGTPKPDG